MAETFASRLKALKKEYGKTDKHLCWKVGIAVSTLQTYKADPDRMPYGVAKRLSQELGCSVSYLLEGKDDMAEKEAYEKAVKLVKEAVKELKGGEKE